MSASTAIIACDNGLGHVRRSALIAKQLEEEGREVTLFASAKSFAKIEKAIPSTTGLKLYDFSTQTDPTHLSSSFQRIIGWLDRIPDLSEFENVICDNLPEILELRPDARLSAQFFWHDILPSVNVQYKRYCEQLLERNRPVIQGDRLFAMNLVRSQPGFQPVDLYRSPELAVAAPKIRPEHRTDLLITGGTTPAIRKRLGRMVEEIIRSGPYSFRKVHIDPELMPSNPPNWVVQAEFSADMYCHLKAAVCRPGLGVLTDLLTVGIKPELVFEEGNHEMTHNAAVIAELFSKRASEPSPRL